MAATLRSTGLATSLVNAIMVHPETGVLTDFASSTVNATMTVEPTLVISDDTWKGATRKKITLAAAKHIAFGANKPTFAIAASGVGVTYVFIGICAGLNTYVVGPDANQYFAGRLTNGGNASPGIKNYNGAVGTSGHITAGKHMFGFSITPGVSNRAFFGSEASADLTIADATGLMPGAFGAIDIPLDYLGRSGNDATQEPTGYFAYLKFNRALTDPELQTLHDDWQGVLLDVGSSDVAPTITTHPAAASVIAGATATFTAAATGTAPTWQWQRSTDAGATWVNISGATATSYTTPATAVTGGSANNNDRYRAVATNGAGSATTNSATLTVSASAVAPAITAQPSAQTVPAGAAATFSAGASGSPAPTWQWQRSTDGGGTWANVSGATSASYTTPAASASGGAANDGDQYRAVATNGAGTATTNAVALSVSAAAPAPAAASSATPIVLVIGLDGKVGLLKP